MVTVAMLISCLFVEGWAWNHGFVLVQSLSFIGLYNTKLLACLFSLVSLFRRTLFDRKRLNIFQPAKADEKEGNTILLSYHLFWTLYILMSCHSWHSNLRVIFMVVEMWNVLIYVFFFSWSSCIKFMENVNC